MTTAKPNFIMDSWFRMGTAHTVCEDYARDETRDEVGFAALSDGCSSSDDTDIGARLLVLGAFGSDSFERRVLEPSVAAVRADMTRKTLGLPISCLDATLGLLRVFSGQRAEALLSGDGAIAWRVGTGPIWWYEVEFPDGAPAYPWLATYAAASKLYFERFPNGRISTLWKGDEEKPYDECIDFGEFNIFEPVRASPPPVAGPIDIAVFSDGITTVRTKARDGIVDTVPVRQFLTDFFDFPRYGPGFVHRRMNVLGRKWEHSDDLSIIAAHIEPLEDLCDESE